MFPDDSRTAMIVEALDALEDYGHPDLAQMSYEFEPRYGVLVEWLGSYAGHRLAYCDEHADEYGRPPETWQVLAGGHWRERLEVLGLVCGSLAAHLDTLAT